MKAQILLFISVLVLMNGYSQEQSYYYYKGNKVELQKFSNREFVLLNRIEDSLYTKLALQRNGFKINDQIKTKVLHSDQTYYEYNWLVIDRENSSSRNKIDKIESIQYNAPFFITEKGDTVGLSHLFYVKIKSEEDVSILEKYAKETNTSIIRQNKFMPLWFTLACTNESIGNALELANYFYESGKFESSHPDLMVEDITHCTNDDFFNDQWGLNNTGQNGGTAGIDINYCHARNVTQGDNNITIAVLDHGFELNHPDLANVSPQSYDTETETSPQTIVRGSHGTACAGIIGGNANNNLGIAGIAPDAQLMSIANNLSGIGIGTQEELADGINWAVANNADVISNSWGDNGLSGDIIDDAIENALDNGRNGLGTVIVFSAGNDNSNVSYPANSNFDIIAVGALSPCGERKSPGSCDGENNWGSNYSVSDNSLDIMAPGVLVPTTDRQGNNGYNPNVAIHPDRGGTLIANDYNQQDYTIWFTGTSAACPHIAGISALILSVNSGLTQHEVGDIIANTAQKVGDYNYQPSGIGGRGTWHNEVGHGLVDAHHAVQSAVCDYPIENTTYTSDVTIDGCAEVELNNVSVENGANLIIENIDNFEVTGPFSIETGSQFTVNP